VTVALYAGSFDPVHLGHLSVIERAERTCDRVIVAVVANPQKSSGMFRPEERLRLLSKVTSHLATVTTRSFYGLTVDLARSEGASVLVRAGHKDEADEFSMAMMNQVTGRIPTLFVPPEPATRTISSSLVRHLVDNGQIIAAQALSYQSACDRLWPT
jgi:pantetheine-phosphate adenylyltransferase